MFIKTKNSTYEVWPEENCIRKTSKNDSTHVVGKDWVTYDLMPSDPKIGEHLTLIFGDGNVASVFTTSRIIDINDEDNFIWVQASDGWDD